jgi:hypothetical protein
MNEEQPITPPPAPEPAPIHNTKLEDLPQAMKDILHSIIKVGYGAVKTKTEFEKKFPTFNDIIPSSRGTYQLYIDRHYDDLMREAEIERQTASSLQEGFRHGANIVDSVLNNDRGSTKEQLEYWKEFCEGRIQFLERAQSTGLPSAQLENAISSYVTSIRTILEKSIEYGKELNKEDEKDMQLYLEGLVDELLDNILVIYQSFHGDIKFQEFTVSLEQKLREIIKAATQERKESVDGTQNPQ